MLAIISQECYNVRERNKLTNGEIKMNQLNQVIDNLAKKLEVPIEVLWASLMKQSQIYAVSGIFYILISAIALIAFSFTTAYFIKKHQEENEEVYAFMSGLFIVASALCFVWFAITLADIPLILAGFYNPEYWALSELGKMFRSN